MGRYAVIDSNGLVTNVILWDGDETKWQPPSGHTTHEDVNEEIGPGFTFDGTTFIAPPYEDPEAMAASAPAKKKK